LVKKTNFYFPLVISMQKMNGCILWFVYEVFPQKGSCIEGLFPIWWHFWGGSGNLKRWDIAGGRRSPGNVLGGCVFSWVPLFISSLSCSCLP
jgi:hypothetical protein